MKKSILKKLMGKSREHVGTRPLVTLCKVIREIYHTTEDENIRSKCELSMIEGKNLVGKLKKHKEMFRKDHKKAVKERKMGMRKHKPVSIKKIEKTRYAGHHTICQFMRDIYAMTDDEEIKLKCRIGMSMAKSMHERLKKYRKMMKAKEIAEAEGDINQYQEEK